MLRELYDAFEEQNVWSEIVKEGVSFPEIARGVQKVVSGVVKKRGTGVARGLQKARAGTPLKVPQWSYDPASGTMARASGRIATAGLEEVLKLATGVPTLSATVRGLADRGMKSVGKSLKVPKAPSPAAMGRIGKAPSIEKIRY